MSHRKDHPFWGEFDIARGDGRDLFVFDLKMALAVIENDVPELLAACPEKPVTIHLRIPDPPKATHPEQYADYQNDFLQLLSVLALMNKRRIAQVYAGIPNDTKGVFTRWENDEKPFTVIRITHSRKRR